MRRCRRCDQGGVPRATYRRGDAGRDPLSWVLKPLGRIIDQDDQQEYHHSTKFVAKPFSTADDNQPAVRIRFTKDEREMASGNKMLGEFQPGRHPTRTNAAPPQIEVAFDIDANGILHVSAKDNRTRQENKDHHQRPTQVCRKTKSRRW